MKLKKVEELAKAEMVSAIAREKAAQIEKMAEANLHVCIICFVNLRNLFAFHLLGITLEYNVYKEHCYYTEDSVRIKQHVRCRDLPAARPL